jgi:hypothetical protein
MVYSTLETESSMALPTDCGRVTGKPEVMPRARANRLESIYEIGSNPTGSSAGLAGEAVEV